MTTGEKRRLFHLCSWGAALLYAWGLFILWMAPEWALSEWTYYLVGVLPVVVGVTFMTTSIGLYLDLREEDD